MKEPRTTSRSLSGGFDPEDDQHTGQFPRSTEYLGLLACLSYTSPTLVTNPPAFEVIIPVTLIQKVVQLMGAGQWDHHKTEKEEINTIMSKLVSKTRSLLIQRPLLTYFILTYVISWIFLIPSYQIMLNSGWAQNGIAQSPHLLI